VKAHGPDAIFEAAAGVGIDVSVAAQTGLP
jgi:hypothetical protein